MTHLVPKNCFLMRSQSDRDTPRLRSYKNFYKALKSRAYYFCSLIGTAPERVIIGDSIRFFVSTPQPATQFSVAHVQPVTGLPIRPLQSHQERRSRAESRYSGSNSLNAMINAYASTRKRAQSGKTPVRVDKDDRIAGRWPGNVHEFHVERDELTRLPLRTSFCRSLQKAVETAALRKQLVAVIFIGLDHFKIVNTIFGHRAGDSILKQVAQRLCQHIGKDDLLARLGGDDFSLMLQNVPDIEAANTRAQRCLETIRESLFVDNQEITMTASIGVAIGPAPRRDDNALGMMQDADIAMASVKLGGRDRVAAYSPELAALHKDQASGRYEVRQRLARLTPREREVLQLLVEGRANKMIAFLLGNSNRTIENHRATIMRKMNAKSLPELVRMVIDP